MKEHSISLIKNELKYYFFFLFHRYFIGLPKEESQRSSKALAENRVQINEEALKTRRKVWSDWWKGERT